MLSPFKFTDYVYHYLIWPVSNEIDKIMNGIVDVQYITLTLYMEYFTTKSL